MSKTIAYARVSTKGQNLDRQIEEFIKLGIPEKNIYWDKLSGKNFDRTGYLYAKKCLETGDTFVIDDLDRLGRNDDLRKEWQYFMENEINVRVLNLPSLNLNYDEESIKPLAKMIRNIVFEIFCWEAQNKRATILRTQADGIRLALEQGRPYGRPKIEIPSNFEEIYKQWKNGEITATKGIELTGLKKNKFYDFAKIYESEELRNGKIKK